MYFSVEFRYMSKSPAPFQGHKVIPKILRKFTHFVEKVFSVPATASEHTDHEQACAAKHFSNPASVEKPNAETRNNNSQVIPNKR